MDNRKSFRFSILPLTTITYLLGIFPIWFDITENKSAKQSYFGVLYGLCLWSTISGFTFYGLFFSEHAGVETFIFKFAGLAFPVILVSSTLIFIVRAKSFSLILDDIFIYSNFLASDKFFLSVFWCLLGEVIILTVVSILFYARSCMTIPGFCEGIYSLLEKITDFTGIYSIGLLSLLQANLLIFLYKIFVIFNNELSDISTNKIHNKNSFQDLVQFESLVLSYDKLFETCKKINLLFGPVACGSAAHTLIQTVVMFYYVLLSPLDRIALFSRIILVVGELWVLLFACELLVNEVSCYSEIISILIIPTDITSLFLCQTINPAVNRLDDYLSPTKNSSVNFST